MIKIELNGKNYWVYSSNDISKAGSKYFVDWCLSNIPDSKLDKQKNLYLLDYPKYKTPTDALDEALQQYGKYLRTEKAKKEAQSTPSVTIGQVVEDVFNTLSKYNIGFTKERVHRMLVDEIINKRSSINRDIYYIDPTQRIFYF